MLASEQNEIIPCIGREQPERCYVIHLSFASSTHGGGGLALLAGIVLILGGIWFYKQRKSESPIAQDHMDAPEPEKYQLGHSLFSYEEQFLLINGEKIPLTLKESKLMHVFAKSPGRIIDREDLQQEVWGNEGVIVSRSLDMFISKLRKKLKPDPAIKLANIHGKGYKLEISQT